MASQYPAQIDDSITLPVSADNSTLVRAAVLNELRTAVIAIESALGVSPASVYGSVRERIAALETSLNTVANNAVVLGGDIGGTNISPLVIGLRGITILDIEPESGQVLAYNGLGWVPTAPDVAGGAFQADGDLSGSNVSQTVIALQGYSVGDTDPTDGYVLTWSDFSTSWEPLAAPVGFSAGGDLSGTESSQTVIALQGFDVAATTPTDGFVLTWSDFSTSWEPLAAPTGFSAGGDLSGSESSQTVIALQGNPVGNTVPTEDYVLAWDGDSWEPALVTTLVSGLTNSEISLVSNVTTTTSAIFERVGGRSLDVSNWPATLNGLTRRIDFIADIQKTSGATSADIQLYDVTNAVLVTGTSLTSTSDSLETVSVTNLTAGSSAGNIRTDTAAQYEVQLKMTGGGGSDAVFLTNARMFVTYV